MVLISNKRRRLHSDDELAEARLGFIEDNDDLTEDARHKIADAIMKVAYKADTFEVAYKFFVYFSGMTGQRIKPMAPSDTYAKKADHIAELTPFLNMNVREDALSADFDDAKLGALLLHEFAHTGHAGAGGAADYQDGNAYAVQYFYAECANNTTEMERVLNIVKMGGNAIASLKKGLQDLFKWSYAVLSFLHQLITKGALSAPFDDLTRDDGELLLVEFIMSSKSPGEDLQKVIDHVRSHLSSFKVPSVEF